MEIYGLHATTVRRRAKKWREAKIQFISIAVPKRAG
jgi:hypothetical protein